MPLSDDVQAMLDGGPTARLDSFVAAYEKDDNLWWMIDGGHHQNLFEAAVDAYDDLRAEVERLRKQHSDLTSRMGFGDGVTEPQADNDTIMRAWEEMSSQSTEWCESQSWRTDCYLAGHSDTEDCHEHDPSLQLSDARAEIEQLRAQVADAWDQGHDAARRGYGKGCTCGGNPYLAALASKEVDHG